MKPTVTVKVYEKFDMIQMFLWGDKPLPYTNWDISIDCNTETNSWFLRWESQADGSVKNYPCRDFYDALHKFKHNCTYYGVACPRLPRTEDEYFGAAPGYIVPQQRDHKTVNMMLTGGALWPTSL